MILNQHLFSFADEYKQKQREQKTKKLKNKKHLKFE